MWRVRLRFRLRAMHHSLCNLPRTIVYAHLSTLSKPVRSECSECSKQECFERIVSTKMGRMWNSPKHWIRLQRNSGAVKPKWPTNADRLEKGSKTFEWASNPQLRKTEYGIVNLNQAIKPWRTPKLRTAWSIQHLLRAGRAKEIRANQCHNICPLCSWRNGGIDRCCSVAMCFNDMKISKTKAIKNLVDSSWLKLELDQEWQMPCKLWACVCVWHLWSGGLKTQDMNGRVGRCLDWYPVKILIYHCRAWFSWLLHSLHFERHHSRFWSIYLQIQSSWLSWNQATKDHCVFVIYYIDYLVQFTTVLVVWSPGPSMSILHFTLRRLVLSQ